MSQFDKEWFKAAVKKIISEPVRIEPAIFIISPIWDDGIKKGTHVCPCHADYRHKDEVKK